MNSSGHAVRRYGRYIAGAAAGVAAGDAGRHLRDSAYRYMAGWSKKSKPSTRISKTNDESGGTVRLYPKKKKSGKKKPSTIKKMKADIAHVKSLVDDKKRRIAAFNVDPFGMAIGRNKVQWVSFKLLGKGGAYAFCQLKSIFSNLDGAASGVISVLDAGTRLGLAGTVSQYAGNKYHVFCKNKLMIRNNDTVPVYLNWCLVKAKKRFNANETIDALSRYGPLQDYQELYNSRYDINYGGLAAAQHFAGLIGGLTTTTGALTTYRQTMNATAYGTYPGYDKLPGMEDSWVVLESKNELLNPGDTTEFVKDTKFVCTARGYERSNKENIIVDEGDAFWVLRTHGCLEHDSVTPGNVDHAPSSLDMIFKQDIHYNDIRGDNQVDTVFGMTGDNSVFTVTAGQIAERAVDSIVP